MQRNLHVATAVYLSHQKTIFVDFGGASVSRCPCHSQVMPCAITFQEIGSWFSAIFGVAAHAVWVWPHGEICECMTCNCPVWIKYGKMVKVGTALLRVAAL